MITMVTGGHGSGKTSMALSIASKYPRKTYIATAEPIDNEIKRKIEAHKKERDASYTTLEVPLNIHKAVREAADTDVILVDCITVWLGNVFHYSKNVEAAVDALFKALENQSADIIFITNESSMSIIPADELSRKYTYWLAKINRRLSEKADNVCFMVSGIPQWIKVEEYKA